MITKGVTAEACSLAYMLNNHFVSLHVFDVLKPSFVISSQSRLVKFDDILMLLTGSLIWICSISHLPIKSSTLPLKATMLPCLWIKTCSSAGNLKNIFIKKSEKGSNITMQYKICLPFVKMLSNRKFPCQTWGNICGNAAYTVTVEHYCTVSSAWF